MRFKYYDVFHSDVMEESFGYLELTKIIVPGKYDVLKYIFANDLRALKKIDEAAKEIKFITSTGKRSISRNKGEFLIINIYQKVA